MYITCVHVYVCIQLIRWERARYPAVKPNKQYMRMCNQGTLHTYTCIYTCIYISIRWERAREAAMKATSTFTHVLQSADEVALAVGHALDMG